MNHFEHAPVYGDDNQRIIGRPFFGGPLGARFSARVRFSVRAPSSEVFWADLLPERFSALGDIRIRRILTILFSDR